MGVAAQAPPLPHYEKVIYTPVRPYYIALGRLITWCVGSLNLYFIDPIRGVSSGGLRGLEHPPKVQHNSQLSSCVTTIVTDKQQLVAKTNNKLTGLTLNGSFLSLLGLKQPSLSSSYLQERVNEGRGQRFGGVTKTFAHALHTRLAQHLPFSNPGHAPANEVSLASLAVNY